MKTVRIRSRLARLTLLVLLAGSISATAAFAATEVNTCGQSFSGSGFLSSDLDCTGFPSDAVTIDGGALDLRGFTLTGGNDNAIFCSNNCAVTSDPAGGAIVNSTNFAIVSIPGSVRVSDAVIDSSGTGISAGGPVLIEDSTITNGGPSSQINSSTRIKLIRTTVNGIREIVNGSLKVVESNIANCYLRCLSGGNVRVKNSTVAGSGTTGILAADLVAVFDSQITGHGQDGIAGFSRAKIIRSSVTGNGGRGVSSPSGVHNGPLAIRDSDISGNALEGAVYSTAIRVVNSTITANGRSGISTGTTFDSDCTPVRLTDSAVTGNGTDGAVCGVVETCADLATCENAPVLNNSTCDTSYDTDSGFPGTSWSVCSLD